MTADLVAFLRQRLDEDEVAARAAEACSGEPGWAASTDGNVHGGAGGVIAVGPWGGDLFDVGEHIARHDPARVLADVQAKRQILVLEDMWGEDSTILLFLAQPFADHPDFDPAWKL